MGKITIRPGGSSAGFPAQSDHARAKRGQIKGWTPAAARRLTEFLWSVEADRLGPEPGLAVTLTTGGRPATSRDWAAARGVLLQRLRDNGLVRHQWLTEWTREGRPHMHMCVWSDMADWELALAWLEICRTHGWEATWRAQTAEPIFDATGWMKYVAKHSARGVDHYQRETPPEGWETVGRLWGRSREGWPLAEPFSVTVPPGVTFGYMGRFVAYQVERMVSEGVSWDVIEQYEARMSTPTTGGELRGLSGWVPAEESVRMLLAAMDAENEENPDRGIYVSVNEDHRSGDGAQSGRALWDQQSDRRNLVP